jgi:hypothetical protein
MYNERALGVLCEGSIEASEGAARNVGSGLSSAELGGRLIRLIGQLKRRRRL